MRIVLAYSGSVECSAALAWLRQERGAEVVAVTVDLGQGRELETIRDHALALGAQRAHVLDTRERFAHRFVVPALKADALHDGLAPMGLALSRPAIAERLVEIAGIERADAVAHAGGSGSRLDRLLRSLAPSLEIVQPALSWSLTPDDLASFARAHGLLPTAGRETQASLWGRYAARRGPESGEGSIPAPKPEADCPEEPAIVDIAFESGVPTALNGVALPLLELFASVDTLAATHGVGRIELDRLVCDAPAAVLLHTAHRALTRAAAPADVEPLNGPVREAYASLVDEGRWFSPLREALDAYLAVVQHPVTGHVRLRLLKGTHTTLATHVAERPDGRPAISAPLPARN